MTPHTHTHTRIKLYCLQKTDATGEFILSKLIQSQIHVLSHLCLLDFI